MMATSEVLEGISSQENKLLPRDRYVATNRFTVRRGKEAAFEKRWATRKSRLASLEGFKYFQLMRRVSLDANNNEPFGDDFNYVSFTIWNDKKVAAAFHTTGLWNNAILTNLSFNRPSMHGAMATLSRKHMAAATSSLF